MMNKLYETCDKVSQYLIDLPEFHLNTYLQDNRNRPFTQKEFEATIFQMYADNYLNIIPGSDRSYTVNTKGRLFIANGGYATLLTQMHEEKALQLAQVQSVIDTNRSVEKLNDKTTTFYRKQIMFTWIIGIASVASAIGAIGSFINSIRDTKLQNSLQSTQEKVRLIQKSLIEQKANDTLYQKAKDSL